VSAPSSMSGKTLGHYRILEKIGEGGMGAVFQAEDLTLRRPVALKFLPSEQATDPAAHQQLLKEARAASRLNHPNIATVYEVGEASGTPFIAMELVQGESLKQILQRGPLQRTQLFEVARQVAEGLNEAHQAGVLHRDVKPGNIMLDSKGRVKILDFGLAMFAGKERTQGEAAETFITRTATQWSTGGTVPYMSPEQLRGDPTDARSDIFSYGVMLYECLSGHRPFRGETSIDVLHAILRQPLPPLRNFVADVPQDWEQLIEQCLEKSPERRFRTMQEVLRALPRATATGARAEKSLAVLYFENLSGAKEDEYFRDGITEDVTTELSRINELTLFPRSAVLAFRDKPITAPQVGQQLGAAFILEGSLRRAGNRLRITAQLVETHTGHTVWADRFDREMKDVFEVQDEIARSISQALRIKLSPQEEKAIARKPTESAQAYDYYLRGRQYFHQFRRKGFDFARQMFARAIVIDPRYARAYAGVADCCSFLYMYWDSSEDNLNEAEAASSKALELDPELAEAHAASGLAFALKKNFDEAQKEFETAIRLDPKLYEAYYFYARTSFQRGDLTKAVDLYEKASRINPDDYQAVSLSVAIYHGLGRIEEAEATERRALELAEKHIELHPDDARALYLGAGILARIGKNQQSFEWARRALSIDPEETSILYNVACVYALLGRTEDALGCLEKVMAHGTFYKNWAEKDSDLDSLRSDPRFQALLKSE
jgi:serine/threonine protein kinase/Flp pilus assembly protein TadD